MRIIYQSTKLLSYIISRRGFYYIGILLKYISHKMMGIGNYENEVISGEKYVVETVKRLLNKESIIFFDVGAGEDAENSFLVNKYFKNAKIYLFEPMPQTYKKLKNNASDNKNMNCFNLALGSNNGKLELWDYKNKQSEHATIHKEQILGNSSIAEKTIVNKITIDSFLRIKRIKKIDFLKIDTEGQEYTILSGAKDTISNISFIQFEFNSMNIYSKVRFLDFYNLLNENFKIYRIYQDGLLEIKNYNPIYHEIYEFQNYLAINRKYDYINKLWGR